MSWEEFKSAEEFVPKAKELEPPDQVHLPTSAVQTLQRSQGNSRLIQARAALQREASSLPDWIQLSWKNNEGIPEAVFREQMAERQEVAGENVSIPSGGSSLPAAVQQVAEKQLGVPMNDVRLVTGGDSATKPMGAQAFTTQEGGTPTVVLGNDVDPSSADGRFTLMHELTHVAQQKQGRSDGLHGLSGDENLRTQLENHADEHAAKMCDAETAP